MPSSVIYAYNSFIYYPPFIIIIKLTPSPLLPNSPAVRTQDPAPLAAHKRRRVARVHHQGTLPQLPTLGSCDRKKKKLHQLLLDPSAIAVAMQGATCGCKSDCFDAVMRQNGSRTVHLIVEQRRVSLGSDVPKLVAELRRHYDTASGTLNAPFPLFGGDGGIPSVCRPVLYFLLAVSQHRARAVHALLASGTAGAVPSRGAALFERAVAFWTLVLEDGSEDQPHEPGVSAASTDGNVLQWKSRITDVA